MVFLGVIKRCELQWIDRIQHAFILCKNLNYYFHHFAFAHTSFHAENFIDLKSSLSMSSWHAI